LPWWWSESRNRGKTRERKEKAKRNETNREEERRIPTCTFALTFSAACVIHHGATFRTSAGEPESVRGPKVAGSGGEERKLLE
jgi:hypothetical protein